MFAYHAAVARDVVRSDPPLVDLRDRHATPVEPGARQPFEKGDRRTPTGEADQSLTTLHRSSAEALFYRSCERVGEAIGIGKAMFAGRSHANMVGSHGIEAKPLISGA